MNTESEFLNNKKRRPAVRPKGLIYKPRQPKEPESQPVRFITGEVQSAFEAVLEKNKEESILQNFSE